MFATSLWLSSVSGSCSRTPRGIKPGSAQRLSISRSPAALLQVSSRPTAMSRFAATAFAAAVLVAVAARGALCQETYSSRFDGTDLDSILADPGRVDQYVRCFLAEKDDGCDEAGRRVKAVLREALTTDCAKCTERQKVALPKTVRFLARERPDSWKQLEAKFDPKRTYAATHSELFQ